MFDARTGAAAGRRSGQVRKRLTVAEVESALGALATPEDAKRRLERLNVWLTAGLLPGAAGHAAVRAVEVWLRAYDSGLETDRVRALAKEVARLKAELRGRAGRVSTEG